MTPKVDLWPPLTYMLSPHAKQNQRSKHLISLRPCFEPRSLISVVKVETKVGCISCPCCVHRMPCKSLGFRPTCSSLSCSLWQGSCTWGTSASVKKETMPVWRAQTVSVGAIENRVAGSCIRTASSHLGSQENHVSVTGEAPLSQEPDQLLPFALAWQSWPSQPTCWA